ncbi:MAG: hypothetical protein QM648_07295 [Solirubrobacterales bacterium]
MCAGCAAAAAAGASGVRVWLQMHPPTWITPARMKAVTIVLFIAFVMVTSLRLSGSTTPTEQNRAVASAQPVAPAPSH